MDSQRLVKRPIIVCDDDEDIREVIMLALQQAGYDVLGAGGFTDLMYFMENVHPSLILLDIRMPEWDGFYVAETLRKRNCKTPIIFITAHDNPFSRAYSQGLGAVGYLAKPFEAGVLLAKVSQVLSQSNPKK